MHDQLAADRIAGRIPQIDQRLVSRLAVRSGNEHIGVAARPQIRRCIVRVGERGAFHEERLHAAVCKGVKHRAQFLFAQGVHGCVKMHLVDEGSLQCGWPGGQGATLMKLSMDQWRDPVSGACGQEIYT